jgi:glycosyltransferase involved in cell wall biosynthesis
MRLFDVKSLGKLMFRKGNRGIAEIVVVIPLYNYAWALPFCLESVYRQTIKNVSVVIVDDCSSDDSLNIAIKWAGSHWTRFCSLSIIKHFRNQGVSMTRNSGIAWSREPFLFMLDADNEIRVEALVRLKEAIDVSRADFAYPQLWQVGDVNLVGFGHVWDPALLAEVNYIDTMALISREALLWVKGYHVVGDDRGLEDYDLWCRFAEAGLSGVFLPEVLGDYRVHSRSRNTTAHRIAQDAQNLHIEMALQHPTIVKI